MTTPGLNSSSSSEGEKGENLYQNLDMTKSDSKIEKDILKKSYELFIEFSTNPKESKKRLFYALNTKGRYYFPGEPVFKLIDDIVTKNKEEAMEIYEEMLKHNEEPIKIIIMLSNQFRLMFQSKKLIKKGYSEKEIAKKLNVHPYPVKLALQKSRNYDESRLLFLLSELADLDFQIKSGEIEKRLGLELFILSL